MKILCVNEHSAFLGGTERYLEQLSIAFQNVGHNLYQINLSKQTTVTTSKNCSYVSVSPYPADIGTAKVQLAQIIAEQRPDIAYIHIVYHPKIIEMLINKLPIVAYIHSPYPICPGSAHYLRRSQKICPHIAGPVCLWNAQSEHCCWGHNPVSHWRLLRRAHEFMRVYQQVHRILVGGNYMYHLLASRVGLPTPVSILPPILMDLPTQWNSQRVDPPLILFAGRLVPEKGLVHLLRALAKVNQPWQLAVAGDGEEMSPCQALTQQLGIAEHVHFLGWLEPEVLNTYYARCTLVVVPSLWPEPYGRIGPEAFAYGRPVVAYAVGGIPDWLTHERNGLLVEPGNWAELGRAISRILSDSSLQYKLGAEARHYAEEHFTFEAHLKPLLECFEQIVKSWQEPPTLMH